MKQTFSEHVGELRRRVLWVLLSLTISGAIGYVLRVRIIRVIQHPLGFPLYYTSPAGSFNFVMKIAFMIGAFITLPIIIYHLVRFIEPALPIKIKKPLLVQIILSSFFLALLGSGFAFFILIPQSLHFFASYSTAQVKPLISANEYLNYVVNTIIAFTLIFQIPLIVLFINRIRPVKPRKLMHYQKHVIIGSFVLAVILPFTYDPISQFIVVIPIVFLFYLSVILLGIVNRGKSYADKPIGQQPTIVEPQPSQAILDQLPELESSTRGVFIDGLVRRNVAPKLTRPGNLITAPGSQLSDSSGSEFLSDSPLPSVPRHTPKMRFIDGFYPNL
ncbi:MAG TPA: twin-arginine translocase subunit TatC [Candidatus Saccharimonadales bacterium]|nr:twin-arginine translocase subunit TatC [Candidatus Saccharimonadales bacterium]